ncbi:MAG: hypothetical protein C0602_06035 [Denitrovibrio sp.]|nr:MAG: hypothetical protein C0602_06035 [Denitrovibrio sp.]
MSEIKFDEISSKIVGRRQKDTYPEILTANEQVLKDLLTSKEGFSPKEIYRAIDKKGCRLSYGKFKKYVKEELGYKFQDETDSIQRKAKLAISLMDSDPAVHKAVSETFAARKSQLQKEG